jgi:hypothetical protein
MSVERESTEHGELNLLPIMNMVCLLIPFLLMAAQFIQIGVIVIETPRSSRVPDPNRSPPKDALDLTLVVTDQGLYLKSRHGAECPEGVTGDDRLCFRRQGGKLTDAVLRSLQHHLWFLHASKYRGEEAYASPEERHAIAILPEPGVRYEELVRILDVVREVPADARNPPVKRPPPSGGCQQVYDRKAGAWAFRQTGGESVKDAACMYHRITLALGSS